MRKKISLILFAVFLSSGVLASESSTGFTIYFYLAIGLAVIAVLIAILLFLLLKKPNKPKWER